MDQASDVVVEEMKKLQGVWKQIAYERDGVSEPPDEQGWEPTTTFVGNTFVVTLANGSTPISGTYRLDPTKDPKTVDWFDEVGEDAGKTIPGVYSQPHRRREPLHQLLLQRPLLGSGRDLVGEEGHALVECGDVWSATGL